MVRHVLIGRHGNHTLQPCSELSMQEAPPEIEQVSGEILSQATLRAGTVWPIRSVLWQRLCWQKAPAVLLTARMQRCNGLQLRCLPLRPTLAVMHLPPSLSEPCARLLLKRHPRPGKALHTNARLHVLVLLEVPSSADGKDH